MKNIAILACAFLSVAVLLGGCQNQTVSNPKQTTDNPSISHSDQPTVPTDPEQTTASTQPSTKKRIAEPPTGLEYVPGTIRLTDQSDDDYKFERPYRHIYYTISGVYMELLSEEQKKDFAVWMGEQREQTNYGEFRQEMLLVSFVKRYNIPREDFDAAVLDFIEFRGLVSNNLLPEENEIANADVIYTFDNEIINYYYRYE